MKTLGTLIPAVTILLSTSVKTVVGHGYLASFGVDNTWYNGFNDGGDQDRSSPVRITEYEIPHYDVYDPIIACGKGSTPSSGIATVYPGATAKWDWRTHVNVNGGKRWTHMEGSSRTFIANCGGDCSTADATQLNWVELVENRKGYDNGRWAARILYDGGIWEERLPAFPNGDYLIRNELTALHFSDLPYAPFDPATDHGGGTEFYLVCAAIRMTGSSGTYPVNQVMRFPGAYERNAPGHYNPNFFSTPPENWVFAATNTFYVDTPSSGNSGNGNSGNSGNSGTTTTAAGTTPSAPSTLCGQRRARRKRDGLARHRNVRRLIK